MEQLKQKIEQEKIEQKEKERIEKERLEKENKEQELKVLQEKENEKDNKNIQINNQTGKELKSLNQSIPKDRELYLDIPLKTKKDKILIPSPEDLSRFRLDALYLNNYYRKYHQVGPMELTDILNNFAQRNAEILAAKDKTSFSSDEDRRKFCGVI